MMGFVLFLLYLPALISSRSRVIIDTDIGTDFDDCVAISYALSRNDTFDIQLILTSTFNATGRAVLTAKYLDYVNRTDVDIGIGISTPSGNRNGGVGDQMPWAEGYDLSKYPGKIYYDGISRAKEILKTGTSDDPIYWIEIAPLPSLGQILIDNSSLKLNMRLITMAGSIYRGYGTNYPQREYNINLNGSSSKIVYDYTNETRYAYDICAAPLDTTYYFQIYGDNYQQILNSKLRIPKIMIENYNVWYSNGGKNFGAYRSFSPTTATSCMYDVQAMFMASILSINSSLLNGKQVKCDSMPYMQMLTSPIIVNNSLYTIQDINNNDNMQFVNEAVTWNGGDHNGTYKLGEYIADALVNPR